MKRYGGTIVCIGTGPSLTLEQIDTARRKEFTLFGCNRVHELAGDLSLLFAFKQFWNYYGRIVHPCDKWTINEDGSPSFVNRIAWRDEARKGLSTDPSYIHHGRSAGFSLVNLAYLAGATRVILLGYDLRYAPDYDGKQRQIGSTPRHYFGEYAPELQHWPSMRVRAGIHEELIGYYESVAAQNVVEIVNCTPGSALTCFPAASIDAL